MWMEETARLPQASYAKEKDKTWWRCEENETFEIWRADVFLSDLTVKCNFKIYVGWIRMSLEYTYFYHLKYHMNFFLHRTQSNVDVDDDTENEDSLISIDGANRLG